MTQITSEAIFSDILACGKPEATAFVNGNEKNPQLNGTVKFFATPYSGVLIKAQIFGLPDGSAPDSTGFFAMHIHENGDCTPPFDQTGSHYNPTDASHPNHAGDLLPLMANRGYAFLAFYDTRFSIPEIIGKSVVIHRMADDFTTQPAGGAGEKIGCGVIWGGESG